MLFAHIDRIGAGSANWKARKHKAELQTLKSQVNPHFMFNTLNENAFKYGISMQYPCFVHIKLKVQESMLHLKIENSVLARNDLEKGTGLGLANVRQRLKLAYPDRHSFHVNEKESVFLVDLTINL